MLTLIIGLPWMFVFARNCQQEFRPCNPKISRGCPISRSFAHDVYLKNEKKTLLGLMLVLLVMVFVGGFPVGFSTPAKPIATASFRFVRHRRPTAPHGTRPTSQPTANVRNGKDMCLCPPKRLKKFLFPSSL